MRIVIGNVIFPPVRQRYRPTCVISWSRQGYENASYCISQTGRQPAMHNPTALPRIPASASGVSKQRFGASGSRSPAVARKTPPARPTSSPITITESSRASSTWNASLIASTMERSAKDPPQFLPVRPQRRRRVDVRVVEHEPRIGGRLGLGGRDPRTQRVRGLALDRLGELVVEDSRASQIALVTPHAFAGLLFLDAFEVDVRARVVSRRVRRGAVRQRLDERRAVARARTLDALACRFVHGEDVGSVDAHARNPVTGCLVRELLRPRLRGDRRRDRPLVVVTEEDQRRARHAREVRSFVERALRGRAVAEERDRDGALAAQLLAPRESGCVRHVRPDRDADRRDVVVGRVPPAGGMTAPPREHCRRGHPAEEADRGLAVRREDPVVVLERVDRACLHRLVVPEDRVRADSPLTVVDDRALVVRAQEDERPVEVEELLLAEAVDLAVAAAVRVADDPPQIALRGSYVRHRAKSIYRLALRGRTRRRARPRTPRA